MSSSTGASWAGALLRRRCDGCRGEDGPLCPVCRAVLAGVPFEARVVPRPPGLPRVVAAVPYAGAAREAVVAHKDHDRWALRAPLGHALARSTAELLRDDANPGRPLVLVPVPGSPGSVRRRDGDHVRELAESAARHLRRTGLVVLVRGLLVPVRRRADQVGLGRDARAANLAGAVAAGPSAARLAGCDVVLVDDLVTTGATLAECARALGSVGVRPVGAAVVAAAQRGGRASSAPRAVSPRGSTFVL